MRRGFRHRSSMPQALAVPASVIQLRAPRFSMLAAVVAECSSPILERPQGPAATAAGELAHRQARMLLRAPPTLVVVVAAESLVAEALVLQAVLGS